jgi:hypothetical protein
LLQNLRKKQKLAAAAAEDDLGSDAMAATTPSTPKTPATVVNTPLTGTTFFGPDFNPEAFKWTDYGSGGDSNAGSPRTPGQLGSSSSLRQTLDCRRQLVMELFQEEGLFPSNQATAVFQARHADLFPSKVCLQLKIREVRQKLMAGSSSSYCSTPTSTSASAHASSPGMVTTAVLMIPPPAAASSPRAAAVSSGGEVDRPTELQQHSGEVSRPSLLGKT